MTDPRFTTFAREGTGRVVSTWRTVQAQPNWVSRTALLVFMLVLAVPVLILLLLALAAGVIVFGTLALVHSLAARLRRALPHRDGRENVVVRRR